MSPLLLLAMLPPIMWGLINHIDKFAVEKFMKGRDPGALVIFTAIAGIVIGLPVLLSGKAQLLPLTIALPMLAAGTMLVLSYVPYLYAMQNDEASNVAPLFQLITPCAYILSLIFLGERIATAPLIAGGMIFIGALVLSFDATKMRIRARTFFLMLAGSLMIALNVVMFKSFALKTSFWTGVLYDLAGAAIAGILLMLLVRSYRMSFVSAIREHKWKVVGVNMFAEILNIFARMINGSVSLLLPIAIVQFVNGLQPFFILVTGIVLTKIAPRFGSEAIDRRTLIQKFTAVILMIAGFGILAFLTS